jgi:hypothetical protein
MTPMFFPTMLSNVKSSLPDLTNTPVLSANTTLEKSTIFMRDSETVVDPHFKPSDLLFLRSPPFARQIES